MMTNTEFCEALRSVLNVKTRYAKGGYGCYASEGNVNFLSRLYPTWYHEKRKKELAGSGAYLFDCVCFIKAVLNGWNGSLDDHFGGSKPGKIVADVGTEAIMRVPHSTNYDTHFDTILPGCIVHKPGHVGVYLGNSEVIECAWDSNGGGVRISKFDGKWDSHARLACINYGEPVDNPVGNVQIPCTWDPAKKTLTISLDGVV